MDDGVGSLLQNFLKPPLGIVANNQLGIKERIARNSDDVEKSISYIIHQLQATGEREVPSKLVGNLVMDELKKLDKVAYIRFASIYLSFEDINEFTKEIEKLKD